MLPAGLACVDGETWAKVVSRVGSPAFDHSIVHCAGDVRAAFQYSCAVIADTTRPIPSALNVRIRIVSFALQLPAFLEALPGQILNESLL